MSNAPWVNNTLRRQGQMVRGTLWKQPGSRFSRRATGAIEYHVQYKCNTLDVPMFLPEPQQVSTDYNNFWLDESDSEELTLGISIISLVYLGVTTIPAPRYTLRCQKISAPVDTNVNFQNIVTAAGGYTQQVDITDGATTNTAKVILDAYGKFQGIGKGSADPSLTGLSIFDDTAMFYIARFVSASRRLDLIRKIETIWTPDGSPPSFPNRNWKLSDINENEIGLGAFYEYEITSELSSQGGWQPLVYGAAAQAATWPRS